MRLFIAVTLDEKTRCAFTELQSLLKARALGGNFSRPENLHVTLVFLGEVDNTKLDTIKTAMTLCCGKYAPFTVSWNRSGCFSRGSTWWAGATDTDRRLSALRNDLCAALDKTGIGFDRKPFRAHVTLGRKITHNVPVTLPEIDIPVPVKRISLMESSRQNGVLVYTELLGLDLAFL
jgi:2'-5' RNA ligase